MFRSLSVYRSPVLIRSSRKSEYNTMFIRRETEASIMMTLTDIDRIIISDYLELISAAKAAVDHFSSLDPTYVHHHTRDHIAIPLILMKLMN